MTSTTALTYPSRTAAVAREHVNDLLRAAAGSRAAACLPDRKPHRTPRFRPAWWRGIMTRPATPGTA